MLIGNINDKYNLKPMDALIVATAKFLRANLVTADKQLFKISEVKVVQIKNE
ncbi:MAG: type II toxin-antitoxin system VapC family toxin [Bacteroidetes bacterium]|nr:MAG: type II toxin-antitoxin system VapC family toxin [Bacteroidota bacterium]TAF92246.1 MAG: type II toxin-antitoxin system VapC family toxin [Bacteroidota bacterium]